MKQVLALVGATGAAVAASACCILPALLGVGAAGTLGLSAPLTPFRPYLIGLTLLLLGAAFSFVYRPAKAICDAQGNCVSGSATRGGLWPKVLLWTVTLLTVGTMVYPATMSYRAEAEVISAPTVQRKTAPVAARTAVFTVGNMTCAECTTEIATALKKISGVQDARVDFGSKRATVRYDPARVSVPQLRAAAKKLGFSAQENRS